MTIRKIPMSRERAKARARKLQSAAAARGETLGYQNALVQVALAAGYANANEMYAQYTSPAALAAAAPLAPIDATSATLPGLIAEITAAGGSCLVWAENGPWVNSALSTGLAPEEVLIVPGYAVDEPGLTVYDPATGGSRFHPLRLPVIAEAVSRGVRMVIIDAVETAAHPQVREMYLEQAADRRACGVDLPNGVALVLVCDRPELLDDVAKRPVDHRPHSIIRFQASPEEMVAAVGPRLHPAVARFLADEPTWIGRPSQHRPSPSRWVEISVLIQVMGLKAVAKDCDGNVGREAASAWRRWLVANPEAAQATWNPTVAGRAWNEVRDEADGTDSDKA